MPPRLTSMAHEAPARRQCGDRFFTKPDILNYCNIMIFSHCLKKHPDIKYRQQLSQTASAKLGNRINYAFQRQKLHSGAPKYFQDIFTTFYWLIF